MDKNYYFVAQLPSLFFDGDPGISLEEFLFEGEKWLGNREHEILSRVNINGDERVDGDPQVFREYLDFEHALRSDLAQWRRSRGTDQEYRPTSFPLSIIREGTPLSAERELLRLRWDYIENTATAHHFDFAFLVLYCLKLHILRRLSTFNKEEGLKTFQNLCEVEV